MGDKSMKIDLHLHSKYSRRPSEWILKKLGCPESFTEPADLYRIAKSKGMSLVTITDHNSIEGCLEIAHMEDTFVSEEVTTYFPDTGCKLHVLVYNIDENIHRAIQKIRENVFDLVTYLNTKCVTHALAHPLYSVNGRLTIEEFEKCLLLFKNLELNGARSEEQNRFLELVLSVLTPEEILLLSKKHGIEVEFPYAWKKNLTGGSDDHSSLTIARRYTEVIKAHDLDEFLQGIEQGKAVVQGPAASPEALAQTVYSIAYQFYENKLGLGKYVDNDIIFPFLDRFLRPDKERQPRLLARINFFWNHRKNRRTTSNGNSNVLDLLRNETHKIIWDDPSLSEILKKGNGHGTSLEKEWFHFVNKVSNKLLFQFAENIVNSLSGAHLVNLFQSLGSAGALYSICAPYFVAFSVFSGDRRFARSVLDRYTRVRSNLPKKLQDMRVAHFTDTYYEVNGVAGTIRQQVECARLSGKYYRVITCDQKNRSVEGVVNFRPIGVYELSLYPEQKLFFPPFLEMLRYCYEADFSHIHSATPGPLGLAALAIAKILRLPLVGTYHTALPQYAQYLTEDRSIADIVWKYIIWYYDQMNIIFVPSRSTARELSDKGISPEKIRMFPRGVDSERFNPNKRSTKYDEFNGGTRAFRLLYVGRVSREKNLHILIKVFRSLVAVVNNLELVVVGDGPFLSEMKKELQGTPSVFTGYLEREELAEVYASCDLFVFPSTTDTFGNVVLEAQASGLPVIVTDSGGPQENMVHGKTGLVVPGNCETSLLNAVHSLILDRERLKFMGRAARSFVENRSFYQAFNEAWKLYGEVSQAFEGHTGPSYYDDFPAKFAVSCPWN